ncbi:uncharacterized protein LOC132631907 [Lycium barbarum]|uniref:uncharacterized protein LOC132631907 n=1 Tax=Lycium barbarum TaxID=112863 RepID=UPI00293E4466|nr:uncharacterized protein LOC132631907 [Lycium barbarum]
MPHIQHYTIAWFEKTLTKSYIQNDDFILPTMDVLPQVDKEAVVLYDKGAFKMKYKIGRKVRLNNGWKEFVDAKGLREGDALRFQVCDLEDRLYFIVTKVEKPEIIDVD